MQYVFLIRSRAGCKKYIKIRLVMYFLLSFFLTFFLTVSTRAYQKHVLHGQETISIFMLIYMQFLTIFYAKTMRLSFITDYDSKRVCRWGVFLNSVRLMGLTPFNAFPF